MKSITIANIPAGIVNNHNEVLYFWIKSSIKSASLFRVDAHHDMLDLPVCRPLVNLTPDSYDLFTIANFNCPAVLYGIVDSIYWHNPHSLERKLQDLGTTGAEGGRRKIGVSVLRRLQCSGSRDMYVWTDGRDQTRCDLRCGRGEVILPQEMKISEWELLIADFDLDGFCCHKKFSINFLPPKDSYEYACYDGVSGFEARVDESISILKLLPKPDLITMARSEGAEIDQRRYSCFVPLDKVDQVQECLIEKLKQIY